MTGGSCRRWLATLCGIAALAVRPVAAENAQAERELGRRFAFEAGTRIPLVRDPEVVRYVGGIGDRVVAGLGPQPFDYHFFIIRDAKVNAFAVPGGYIYVHSGLLQRIRNDDELAGVLGHEIAHVHAHHLARQQENGEWLGYAQLLAALASLVQPAAGAAALGAASTAKLQYSRELEQEADYMGARSVQQSGFSPEGMLDFFQRLWEDERRTTTAAPPYLLSHPLTEERLNRLEAVLRKSGWNATPRPSPSAALERARFLARVRTEPAEEVLREYRERVRSEPASAEARVQLGSALLETGAYESARVTLEQARTLGAADTDRDLGRALLRLRDAAGARDLLARAVGRHPDDAVACYEYGRALESLGDTPGALAALRQAVALAPDLEDAQQQLGLLLGRNGDAGEGYYHLGKALLLRGEYTQAQTQLTKAEPLLPEGEARRDTVELLAQLRAKDRD